MCSLRIKRWRDSSVGLMEIALRFMHFAAIGLWNFSVGIASDCSGENFVTREKGTRCAYFYDILTFFFAIEYYANANLYYISGMKCYTEINFGYYIS